MEAMSVVCRYGGAHLSRCCSGRLFGTSASRARWQKCWTFCTGMLWRCLIFRLVQVLLLSAHCHSEPPPSTGPTDLC